MQTHRITYFLIVLVLITGILVFGQGLQRKPQKQEPQDDSRAPKMGAHRVSFPVVDYDESEPADPVERDRRKEKQSRYDDFRIVAREPHSDTGEIAFIGEGGLQIPVLPTDQSNVIIVGVVQDAQAHLSANKKNVYSEFTVQIKEVLKAETSLPANNLITVDRQGGVVRYPNGQKVLYRSLGDSMPHVGGRYMFFLRYVEPDYRILTAYELSEKGATPLDDSPKFRNLAVRDEASFLNTVRDSLTTKPSPKQEQ